MADYILGTKDPSVSRDKGAGFWDSESTTLAMRYLRQNIKLHLVHAKVMGLNAADHLEHYLDNSGNDYSIDLEAMVSDVESASKLFKAEVASAMRFVETLPVGTHEITSRQASGGYNTKEESWDWYYGVGGYSAWGKGKATVAKNQNGFRVNSLLFEYRFFDRYNWDNGKKVTIGPVTVTDEFMGQFHREGIAKEFDMYGSIRRNLIWEAGRPPSIVPVPNLSN